MKPKEIKFPFTVKAGSVTVRIYSTPSHGCLSFTLSYSALIGKLSCASCEMV